MSKVAASQATTFGALLKRYRRAAALSQEALADRVGYSVGRTCSLEQIIAEVLERPSPEGA
jgi:transcriptional regulator with XRE-family HTH domain